jgi:hypothetical protein
LFFAIADLMFIMEAYVNITKPMEQSRIICLGDKIDDWLNNVCSSFIWSIISKAFPTIRNKERIMVRIKKR